MEVVIVLSSSTMNIVNKQKYPLPLIVRISHKLEASTEVTTTQGQPLLQTISSSRREGAH